MPDDIMDYIGYEYVTSHLDEKKKTQKRIRVTPHRSIEVDGLDLRFQEKLRTLSEKLYLEFEMMDSKRLQNIIRQLSHELDATYEEYTKIYPDRPGILGHVYLDGEHENHSLYFVEAVNEEDVFSVMKANFLSNGQYYSKNNGCQKYPISGGVIEIKWIKSKMFMVVLELNI